MSEQNQDLTRKLNNSTNSNRVSVQQHHTTAPSNTSDDNCSGVGGGVSDSATHMQPAQEATGIAAVTWDANNSNADDLIKHLKKVWLQVQLLPLSKTARAQLEGENWLLYEDCLC